VNSPSPSPTPTPAEGVSPTGPGLAPAASVLQEPYEAAAGSTIAATVPANSLPLRSAAPPAVEAVISADQNSALWTTQAQPAPPGWVSAVDPVLAAADVSRPVPTGPTLAQALGEHLQLQIARGSESAVIRLDPPSMGSIEIVIRHEAGGVQVHLNASNAEVLNQLQGIGDALRQDLMQRHQGAVSVQVSDDSGDAGRRQRQASGSQDEPEPSVRESADDEEPAPFSLA
jgi:flagellar hook-length control protein FliK